MTSDGSVAVWHFEVALVGKFAGRADGGGEMAVSQLATVDKYAWACRGVYGGQNDVGAVLSAAHNHTRVGDDEGVKFIDTNVTGVHLSQQ